jgi:hypothetical protein
MADKNQQAPTGSQREGTRRSVRPYVLLFRGLFSWLSPSSKGQNDKNGQTSLWNFDSRGVYVAGALTAACAAYFVANMYQNQRGIIPSNGFLNGLETFNYSKCTQASKTLLPGEMIQTIMLALHHILYAQLVDGNFVEEYNWTNMTMLKRKEDPTIQAKGLWTLALAYRHVRSKARCCFVYIFAAICARTVFDRHIFFLRCTKKNTWAWLEQGDVT